MKFPVRWCLLLALWSCAPPPPARRDWSPAEGLEALLRRAAADLQAIEDLRAEAEITFAQAGLRRRASAALLFKQPDLFRVEVRGPFFVSLFTAVVQADSVIFCDAEGAWSKTALSGSRWARWTGVDLKGYDLRCVLLGLVAPAPLDSVAYPRPGQALVWLSGPPWSRRLWIDARRGLATREEFLDSAGEPLLVRQLRDYRQVGPLYLPRRVEIRQGETVLALRYRGWMVNAGLADEAFTRGIPLDHLERVE